VKQLALGGATVSLCLLLSSPLSAQRYLTEGSAGLALGVEGGQGESSVAWQRARTSLWGGLELRVDERPQTGYQARAFVELERRIGVGGEFGVTRHWRAPLQVFAGAITVLAPRTLFGGTLRAHYPMPLSAGASLSPYCAFSALPLGSDLPKGSALFWLNLGVGFSAPL
jgi:hypothetical protein